MKKLVMILIAVATLQVSAQDQKREMKKQRMESKTPYTPEQMAQLKAKKMTLNLDLNDNQQKEMSSLFLEEAKLRQSKKEAYLQSKAKDENKSLSNDERFEMANARLDHQIEMKKKMKGILSAEQFEKWEMNNKRSHYNKKYAMRHNDKRQNTTPKEAKK